MAAINVDLVSHGRADIREWMQSQLKEADRSFQATIYSCIQRNLYQIDRWCHFEISATILFFSYSVSILFYYRGWMGTAMYFIPKAINIWSFMDCKHSCQSRNASKLVQTSHSQHFWKDDCVTNSNATFPKRLKPFQTFKFLVTSPRMSKDRKKSGTTSSPLKS